MTTTGLTTCSWPIGARTSCIATMATARSKMSPSRPASPATAGAGGQPAASSTTTATGWSTYLSPTMSTSIPPLPPNRAGPNRAGTTTSPLRAARRASAAEPISSTAITATGHSQTCPRTRESRIPAAWPTPRSRRRTGVRRGHTAWERWLPTLTTMAGQTSTSLATRLPACSTETTGTGRSARSESPPGARLTRTAPPWQAWAWESRTMTGMAGSISCARTSPTR